MKTMNFLMPIFFKNKLISRKRNFFLLSFLLLFSGISQLNAQTADWLKGSWGVRLIVKGGIELNTEMNNGYDYVAGAQQIVSNYTTAGHVITNLSENADGSKFTLRTNPNINLAQIDNTMVPSLANEQVILDVINTLRAGGKKVIMYFNYTIDMNRGTNSQIANWAAYVNSNYAGDFAQAFEDLIEGYVIRLNGLVDGYWVDNFAQGTNTEKSRFVQMMRDVDPTLAITVNNRKLYFEDNTGTNIKVDSDGNNDPNAAQYDVIKYNASNIWSDFTAGHVTSLGAGAPANSWAYEEFTIPDMIANTTSSWQGTTNVLHHMFTPIRERWSSEALPLQWTDQDQVYRVIKKITDAEAAFTFSTTNSNGLIMPDELAVLQYANAQLAANAPYVPYTRPAGAKLVGESAPNYHQIIDFQKLPEKDVNDPNFAPGAGASSGAAVSYTSSNTAVATIVGGNINIQGAGTTTITASQGGNGTFAAATNVSRQLTVTGGGSGNTNLALNGTATQSTTLNGAVASRAIDGNTNGNFGGGSVIAAQGPNAWWEVDLGGTFSIDDINVFNRTNSCCINRLSNFTVSVINNGTTTFSQTITTAPTPSETVDAGGAVGQIVRIESNTTDTLNLAEVEVYGNASSTTFVPDPNKTYYIDCPHHNLRLAAGGSSDDPYTTATTTTGNDVEWKFVDNGNGYWHIDRAAGGTQPRLRTDGTANADMNQQGISANTYYELSEGSTSGTHFLTLPNATTNFKRLQINNASLVKMTNSTSNGTWESFTITEVSCATFSTIEAEDYDDMLSVVIGNSTDTGGGQKVGQIHNSDWCRYDDIDLTCATSVEARLASAQSGGSVEVRIDSVTGTLIGTISQGGTGGWQNWVTASDMNLTSVSGVHDVYLVFTGGNTALFNFNWFEFSNGSQSKNATNKKTPITEKDTGNSLVMYPNPVSNIITIDFRGTTAANIRIFDYSGKTIRSGVVKNGSNTIDLSDLASGLYIIKVFNEKETYTRKLIKN